MKNKLFPALLVLIFSFFLSACNKTTPNSTDQKENKTEVKEEVFSKKSTLKTLSVITYTPHGISIGSHINRFINYRIRSRI